MAITTYFPQGKCFMFSIGECFMLPAATLHVLLRRTLHSSPVRVILSADVSAGEESLFREKRHSRMFCAKRTFRAIRWSPLHI